MNSFDRFASFSLASSGEHVVKLVGADLVKPESEDAKEYIHLSWEDSNGVAIQNRLYSARVPAFMTGCAIQSQGVTAPMKLSELFGWLSDHQISVWVSYDEQYGLQLAYRKPLR